MKKLLLLTILLVFNYTFSQKNCEYSQSVTDSIGSYKSTKDYIMHERFFGNNQTTIFFSLVNADGTPSLTVQIIQKNTDFITARCLDKNSKVYFQLANGKIITLLAMEEETCGNGIRNEGITARILTGYFLFMKGSMEDLKSSPIALMRIKYSGETLDYLIKPSLVSENDKQTYFPENYFINYLKCVE